MPTPDEIASRQFLIALRGYDRDEVSAFLAEVAEERRELERRIAALEAAVEDGGGEPRTAFRQLGDETTRILVAAEEAATQMRERAETEARDTLETAHRTATQELDEARRAAEHEREEAHRTAQEELQSTRRRAQEELDRARRQAEELVAEARADAGAAIDTAEQRRQEIEAVVRDLEAARDRLAAQLDDAIAAVSDVTAELRGRTTTDAPAPAAEDAVAAAVEDAARTGPERPDDEEVDEAAPAAADVESPTEPEPPAQTEPEPSAEPEPEPPAEPEARPPAELDQEPSAEPEAELEPTPEPEPPAEPEPAAESEIAAAGEAEVEDVAAPAEVDAGVEPTDDAIGVTDVGAAQLRDRSVGGIRPGMLRRLKRTLQDVQNGVLDAIRRTDGRGAVEELLPTDEDVSALGSVGEAFLAEAYRAGLADGATLAGTAPDDAAAGTSRVADAASIFRNALAHEIAASLEATLRAGSDAGEDATSLSERVGEVFRDLKGPVAEATVETGLVRTYELGVHDVWRHAGVTKRVWVLGEEPRCPENRCRGNADEGPVVLDDPFPSGDDVPPAHPGCTCVVAPA